MTPAELIQALQDHGVAISHISIDGRAAFLASKQVGDLNVEQILLDLPIRVPASMKMALCRSFDIPLQALAVAAHDL